MKNIYDQYLKWCESKKISTDYNNTQCEFAKFLIENRKSTRRIDSLHDVFINVYSFLQEYKEEDEDESQRN